jgi:hypothetical protein
MPSTTYGASEQRPSGVAPVSPEADRPDTPDVSSTEDIDIGWWEKALSDAERAEKNWRTRGRDIVQIYRGDIPITRPRGGKYNASTSYSTKQDTASAFNHPLRQHRSDAAGGVFQAARSRRQVPFRQEDRGPYCATTTANDAAARDGTSWHGAARDGSIAFRPSPCGRGSPRRTGHAVGPSTTGRGRCRPSRTADTAAWGPDAGSTDARGTSTAPYPSPGNRGPASRRGPAS